MAIAFFPLPGKPGSPVPPEGGGDCVVANGVSPVRTKLFISASEVSPQLLTGTVLTRGWKGLGQVFTGEPQMPQQLFTWLAGTEWVGRARWGPVPERKKKIGKTRRKKFLNS